MSTVGSVIPVTTAFRKYPMLYVSRKIPYSYEVRKASVSAFTNPSSVISAKVGTDVTLYVTERFLNRFLSVMTSPLLKGMLVKSSSLTDSA